MLVEALMKPHSPKGPESPKEKPWISGRTAEIPGLLSVPNRIEMDLEAFCEYYRYSFRRTLLEHTCVVFVFRLPLGLCFVPSCACAKTDIVRDSKHVDA